MTAPPAPPDGPGAPGPGGDAAAAGEAELADDVLAKVSEYLDGALAGAERDEVARKIASDPAWGRAHAELTETRRFLSGLHRAPAPPRFSDGVAEKIHRRSAGQLFARRTFGDRVPFGALLLVALAGLAVLAYLMWSSPTGSLRGARDRPPTPGSASVLPHP